MAATTFRKVCKQEARPMLAKAPPPPVFRQTDATRINALMNHPSALPWVRLPGQDSLDLAGFIADPANVALANEDGRGGNPVSPARARHLRKRTHRLSA